MDASGVKAMPARQSCHQVAFAHFFQADCTRIRQVTAGLETVETPPRGLQLLQAGHLLRLGAGGRPRFLRRLQHSQEVGTESIVRFLDPGAGRGRESAVPMPCPLSVTTATRSPLLCGRSSAGCPFSPWRAGCPLSPWRGRTPAAAHAGCPIRGWHPPQPNCWRAWGQGSERSP